MPFANSGDASIDPREGGFETLEKGEYTLTGIKDYFSKDEEELPIFKPYDNGLRAMCHFSLEQDTASLPAWSGTKEDFYKLAKNLGANVDGLVVENTSHFLLEIQKRINSTNVTSPIYVGDKGWVRKVVAMLPPDGLYKLRFEGAMSLDGSEPISFQTNSYTFNGHLVSEEVLKLLFLVESDISGNQEYKDTPVWVNLVNPFDGVFDNQPAWLRAQNGGMLISQRRMMAFLNCFWDGVENYIWQTDPEKSDYGINEAENPIVVIVEKAKQNGSFAAARLEVNSKGFIKTDLAEFSPIGGVPTTVRPVVEADVSEEHKKLIATIEDLASAEIFPNKVFDPKPTNPYSFTSLGGTWCKNNVAPIWDKLGLGETRNFMVLTDKQASMLATKLVDELGNTNTF